MKTFRLTVLASLLTIATSSTVLAGNIGGMRTDTVGNIGGCVSTTGNIGGLKSNTAGNIGGMRNGLDRNDTLSMSVAGNIGGLLSFLISFGVV